MYLPTCLAAYTHRLLFSLFPTCLCRYLSTFMLVAPVSGYLKAAGYLVMANVAESR